MWRFHNHFINIKSLTPEHPPSLSAIGARYGARKFVAP